MTFGDCTRDCISSTWVDSALAGSQLRASFCSALVSFPASGPARATTTSQNATTAHLDHRPAGTPATERNLPMETPPPRWRSARDRCVSRPDWPGG